MKSLHHSLIVLVSALLCACSATKFVPDNEYLLEEVELKSDQKGFDAAQLEPYIRQKANSKWFSIFKIPLGTYSLAGRDTTKWINRTLQKFGEKPVVYDTLQARLSKEDLRRAMVNLGYMHARVDLKTKVKGKRLKAVYMLSPGEAYRLSRVEYLIDDPGIDTLLRQNHIPETGLRPGQQFTVSSLDNERSRITSFLQDHGYYRFHKDFIQFEADSARDETDINVRLHLLRYRTDANRPETDHSLYRIGSVKYTFNDSTNFRLRRPVLLDNTDFQQGEPFSASALQRTYNNFARLQAVRFTNISFTERPDTTLLDAHIALTPEKRNSISFQPEGTNTAGDLGAAASLSYTNRNLFHGSEVFSVTLRAAYEAIRKLEGYTDKNYLEYGIDTKLTFPRFLAPWLSRSFRHQYGASTELGLSWNMQNRPEFHRRVLTAAMRYRWSDPGHNLAYRFDLIDLNYVYMPSISETFRREYLDNASSRNAILRYNYEDLFIMKMGFALRYSTKNNVIRTNIETSGNLLNAFSHLTGQSKNDRGQYTLFNIAYAQYVKFDFDYTHLFSFSPDNELALHAALGIAWPYGNSTVLPYEKRYFSGGANSVRGWGVRELGPGKYHGNNGVIDFINQTGDMKLDLSAEYRTHLFWKFYGAAFIDAGNIWTLREYEEQPGGQFSFKDFYKQIAVAYGLGIRLNFDYFILRFDFGMKAINPAYESTDDEHYPIIHPDFSRDFSFHFAVGLPF